MYDYDLVVIGAGPGGYVGAIRASQLGMKVAVVEKDKPGGVCLNVGCIPSKSLIHQAQIYSESKELEKMGVKIDYSGFDYSKVFKKSRITAQKLSKGVQFLLKKNEIDYVSGEAKITGEHEITVDGEKKITCKFLLVATGSRPREIPGFEFNETDVLSSTGALMLENLPPRMLILGSGAIGVEFTHIMSSFGTQVHLVEMLDRILPIEDSQITEVVHGSFKKRGVKIYTSTKAKGYERTEEGLKVSLESPDGTLSSVTVDKMLVAVGRSINTENLGLEEAGVILERGFIKTGDFYKTDSDWIYAAGDVISSPLLAHVASKEAEIAVENMAGHKSENRVDANLIPGATYSEPQVASFGYTEDRAKKEDIRYECAVFPYRAAGKAVAIDSIEGMVKIVYSPDDHEILGAHIVGTDATEMIHEILLAKKQGIKPQDIATMIHAHPTISETVMECMRMVEGWAIHI